LTLLAYQNRKRPINTLLVLVLSISSILIHTTTNTVRRNDNSNWYVNGFVVVPPSNVVLKSSLLSSSSQTLFTKTNQRKSISSSSLSSLFMAASATTTQKNNNNRRKPSRVIDDAGPTPSDDIVPMETIAVDDIPELADISDPALLQNNPIPHQLWRRGDTAGCEDPIISPWRLRAEEIIYKAVQLVGGSVLDVTWYLTAVIITIDDEVLPIRDLFKSTGPVIDIIEPMNPLFYDPNDPEPEEIWDDDDDVLYLHETEEEAEESALRKRRMYAPVDPDLDGPIPTTSSTTSSTSATSNDSTSILFPDQAGEGDDVPMFMNEETRSDVALKVTEDEQERYEENEQPLTSNFETSIMIDTAAISTIAEAILEALKEEEETLQVLSRHEIIVSGPCPSDSDLIETQKQFNAYRDEFVVVQTIDPFQSNRMLKGKLIDRNSMDLMINQKGRMVTIPLNFVQCVRLATAITSSSSAGNTRTKGGSGGMYTESYDDEEDEDEEEYDNVVSDEDD
jgi:ribosome maturation factor RimP